MTDDARMPDVPDLTRICKIGSITMGIWDLPLGCGQQPFDKKRMQNVNVKSWKTFEALISSLTWNKQRLCLSQVCNTNKTWELSFKAFNAECYTPTVKEAVYIQ